MHKNCPCFCFVLWDYVIRHLKIKLTPGQNRICCSKIKKYSVWNQVIHKHLPSTEIIWKCFVAGIWGCLHQSPAAYMALVICSCWEVALYVFKGQYLRPGDHVVEMSKVPLESMKLCWFTSVENLALHFLIDFGLSYVVSCFLLLLLLTLSVELESRSNRDNWGQLFLVLCRCLTARVPHPLLSRRKRWAHFTALGNIPILHLVSTGLCWFLLEGQEPQEAADPLPQTK